MSELTWASHPNAELRLRLADYLAHGWTVTSIDASSAIVRRSRRSSALVLINVLFAFLRKPVEVVTLTVMDDGMVMETRR